jgi:hypothetical protein
MAEFGLVELAAPLDHQPAGHLLFLEPGVRGLEVAGIGKAIGADRPAIGQGELGAVVLADVAARRPVDQLDLEHQPARQNGDLARDDLDYPHFGDQPQAAHLRHHQHFAVGVEEVVADHRRVGDIDMCRHAGLPQHVAGCGHGVHAGDEIGWRVRHRHRVPAVLSQCQLVVADVGRALPQWIGREPEPAGMLDAGPDAIQPAALVGTARRGEGRTRELLGIEPVGRPLRRVAPLRQRTRESLVSKSLPKPGM